MKLNKRKLCSKVEDNHFLYDERLVQADLVKEGLNLSAKICYFVSVTIFGRNAILKIIKCSIRFESLNTLVDKDPWKSVASSTEKNISDLLCTKAHEVGNFGHNKS